MKYKKSFKEIMEQLKQYKTEIDDLAIAYSEEKEKHEKQLRLIITSRLIL